MHNTVGMVVGIAVTGVDDGQQSFDGYDLFILANLIQMIKSVINRRIHLHTVLTERLRLIQSVIRPLDPVRDGIIGASFSGYTDRHGQIVSGLHVLSFENVFIDRASQFIGATESIVIVRGQQIDREFFSSVSEYVLVAENLPTDLTNGAQSHVALLVAQIIVIGFEVVDVHKQNVLLFFGSRFVYDTPQKIKEISVIV